MKKTLILAAAFACAAFTANADIFTETWTTWTPGYQSLSNGVSGILKSDEDSSGSAVLTIANGNTGTRVAPFLGNSYYSFSATPSFTFANADGESWSGVAKLILKIGYGGPSQEDTAATLVYNGGNPIVQYAVFSENQTTDPQDPNQFYNVYTWDIDDSVDLTSFSIQFDVVGQHTAFGSFELSAIAVPEPSTYALILGGLGLAGVVIARRRRA